MNFSCLSLLVSFSVGVWLLRGVQAHLDPHYHKLRALKSMESLSPTIISTSEPRVFKQKIDHFEWNSTTFDQYYFVNKDFWDADTGPILLFLGGQQPLDFSRVSDPEQSAVAWYAQKLNAMIVGLEHRFYGKSQPVSRYTTESLRLLSVEQALEDVDYFWAEFVRSQNLTSGTHPWIAIGASYSGALAAWSRLKFPHMLVGALASSAPMEATLDFFEYDHGVTRSLQAFSGGCLANTMSLMNQINSKVDADMTDVKKSFGCEAVKDNVDFAYIVADAISFAAQYNQLFDSSLFTYDLRDEFCVNITESATMQTLAQYVRFVHEQLKVSCEDAGISRVVSETGDAGGTSVIPSFYQSCSQLGFFQTAPKQGSLRSSAIDVDWFLGYCRKAFGSEFTKERVSDLIQTTNDRYGGRRMKGRFTAFVNGAFDPWKSVSILRVDKSMSRTLLIVNVTTGTHCPDFHAPPENFGDESSVLHTRLLNEFRRWLIGHEDPRSMTAWYESPLFVGGMILICLVLAMAVGITVTKMRKKERERTLPPMIPHAHRPSAMHAPELQHLHQAPLPAPTMGHMNVEGYTRLSAADHD